MLVLELIVVKSKRPKNVFRVVGFCFFHSHQHNISRIRRWGACRKQNPLPAKSMKDYKQTKAKHNKGKGNNEK
jgi:hypothetical protein